MARQCQMRKTVLCVITSILGLSVMQSVLMAADWPCFRGPTQNGISSESFVWPKDGPKQVWKTNVGVGHSAVSAVGKRVFTMGNTDDTDVVYCLDANTGKEIWHYAYACKARYFAPKPYDGPGATPTVSQGVVYTLSRMGHAFALDEKTGAVVWQRELAQEEGVKRPVWDNKNMNNHWPTCVLWQDYLYGCEGNNAAGAGRSPNALRCLNWNTGNIVWEEASIGFFSLIIVDAKLLMLTDHGVLIAAATSPAGYQELGRAQVIDEKCFTAPSFANNYVYLRNTEGDVVCVDMLLARR
jgi:outer membrane protein assembly factor BamB